MIPKGGELLMRKEERDEILLKELEDNVKSLDICCPQHVKRFIIELMLDYPYSIGIPLLKKANSKVDIAYAPSGAVAKPYLTEDMQKVTIIINY